MFQLNNLFQYLKSTLFIFQNRAFRQMVQGAENFILTK